MDASMESRTPEDVIGTHLEEGERLLWAGRPGQGVRLRGADAFLIPFSILWCGFAVFWEIMVLAEDTPGPAAVRIIFPAFGALLVLVGLYFVFGRFLVDAWLRGRTTYGVTNERVIIVSGLFSARVKRERQKRRQGDKETRSNCN